MDKTITNTDAKEVPVNPLIEDAKRSFTQDFTLLDKPPVGYSQKVGETLAGIDKILSQKDE